MIRFTEDKCNVNEYLEIRGKVGWKILSAEQAGRALSNTICMVSVYDDSSLIGIGRLVGDRAVISYIQDLIVLPEYRKKGIGRKIVKVLTERAAGLAAPGEEMMLGLMSAKGREGFYKACGFIERPTGDLGPGMIMYLKGKENDIDN